MARRLVPVLPRAERVELPGIGHMGPITHPEVVNAEIARFLARVPGICAAENGPALGREQGSG